MAAAPTERQQGAAAREMRTLHRNKAARLRADVAVVACDIHRHKRQRRQDGRPAPVVNEYYVLIGAELDPVKTEESGVRTPPVMCGENPPKHSRVEAGKTVAIAPGFAHVSTRSVLGPPYRAALACTCPDWQRRSGFVGPRNGASKVRVRSLEHAAVGCKHMMICNAEILETERITFGSSAAASKEKEMFLKAQCPSVPNNDTTFAIRAMTL